MPQSLNVKGNLILNQLAQMKASNESFTSLKEMERVIVGKSIHLKINEYEEQKKKLHDVIIPWQIHSLSDKQSVERKWMERLNGDKLKLAWACISGVRCDFDGFFSSFFFNSKQVLIVNAINVSVVLAFFNFFHEMCQMVI